MSQKLNIWGGKSDGDALSASQQIPLAKLELSSLLTKSSTRPHHGTDTWIALFMATAGKT